MLIGLTSFVGSGTLLYLWLTAILGPLVDGLRASLHGARGGWGPALPAALGLVFSATIVPAAALFLLATWSPNVAVAALESSSLSAGLLCGALLFVARATFLGLPRLAPRIEAAIATAFEIWTPEGEIRAFEASYRRHVIHASEGSGALQSAGISALHP